jgi:hypothetical protein
LRTIAENTALTGGPPMSGASVSEATKIPPEHVPTYVRNSRQKLQEHYRTDGKFALIRMDIPKADTVGGYLVRFTLNRWLTGLLATMIAVGLCTATWFIVRPAAPPQPTPYANAVFVYDFDSPQEQYDWRPFQKFRGSAELPNAVQDVAVIADHGVAEFGTRALRVSARFDDHRRYAAVATSLFQRYRRTWDLSHGTLTVTLFFDQHWPILQDRNPGIRVFLRDDNERSQWGCWNRLNVDELSRPVTITVQVVRLNWFRKWFGPGCEGFHSDWGFSPERVRWVGVSVESNDQNLIHHSGAFLLDSLKWERSE